MSECYVCGSNTCHHNFHSLAAQLEAKGRIVSLLEAELAKYQKKTGEETVIFSKCRFPGCGLPGVGIDVPGLGSIHVVCELKRLNDLYEEKLAVIDSMRAEIMQLRAKLEQLRALRVTCACGKDTADIKYAQCYNCRQVLPNEIEQLQQERNDLRAELKQKELCYAHHDACLNAAEQHIERLQAKLEVANKTIKNYEDMVRNRKEE